MDRDTRTRTGRLGEDAAVFAYRSLGYRVVARNWRCRLGELDLIVSRAGTLVFCEVKTRRGAGFGGGFEAVDARKQQKLRALAEAYLMQTSAAPRTARFDVASVWLKPDDSASIHLYQDAF